MENRPTQLKVSKSPPPQDRTASLRALLDYPSDVDVTTDIIKEIGRVLVMMNTDLVRVPAMSNQIAILSSQLQDFFENMLHSRLSKEEEDVEIKKKQYEDALDRGDESEIEFYRNRYDAARQMVQRTSQKIEAVKDSKPKLVAARPEPKPFSWWEWFRDKFLDKLIWLALGFVGSAIWYFFKYLISQP
jgi:hypothetical protein